MFADVNSNQNVYDPSEDSYLLAKHAMNLKGKILEIGVGSGVVLLTNAQANPDNKLVGIDINPQAVFLTLQNAKKLNISNIYVFESDLFANIHEKFDVILFNPPYLPTEDEEKVKTHLNYAFDGGKDGREILDVFLAQFDHYLNENGFVLLIHSSLNDPDKTIDFVSKKGFTVEIIEKRSFFFETIILFKIYK